MGDQNFEKCFLLLTFLFFFLKSNKRKDGKTRKNVFFVGHILIHFSLFLAIFAPFFKNVTKCVIVFYWQMCTFAYLYISPFVHCLFFKRTKKCDVWCVNGQLPNRVQRKKKGKGGRKKKFKKMIVLKTQSYKIGEVCW